MGRVDFSHRSAEYDLGGHVRPLRGCSAGSWPTLEGGTRRRGALSWHL
ncbi:Hypothetical protein AA314_00574 [Archangium gephyra]|uniref:Uncharacterized protein n=1 Tax=Archangium gephyra TaxID=48 RepID=A0AAC8TAS7_9BACT|nr:Hypothetical protein AA314_00574 [Archangium gephyra]